MGAIDGKHCQIQCFDQTGSVYYNYKGTFSIVLMAISDADLNFIYVDVGIPGSQNDAGIWSISDFKQALDNGTITFPEAPQGTIPFHLLRDDAFGMKENLLKPYPRNSQSLTNKEKIFNYRFSRARRVVENAFGLLVRYTNSF